MKEVNMELEIIVVWMIGIALISLFGYANYKAALIRSKRIFCIALHKDEENCDFLVSNSKKKVGG